MDEETLNQEDQPRPSRSRKSNRESSRGRSSARGNNSNRAESSNDDNGKRQEPRGNTGLSTTFLWLGRIIILGMVVIAPWPLASVHAQAQFWLLASAVAGLTMWWFSMAFNRETTDTVPYLAFPVVAGLILLGLQLLPLGETLSGFVAPKQAELFQEYATPAPDELLSDIRNPVPPRVRISMDTDATQKMFNLLLLGLVGLMAGSHFFSSRKSIYLLPLAITINGMAISCLGIAARLSSSGVITSIFGVKLTQGGSPFIPFVNRNNAAGYLLICLAGSLAVLYGAFYRRSPAGQRPRKIITREYPIWKRAFLNASLFVAELNGYRVAALLATLTICCGITMTLSRGGIFAMILALVVTAGYHSLSKKSISAFVGLGVIALLAGATVFASGYSSKINSRFEKLNDQTQSNNIRLEHWAQTSPAIVDFMPFGSGLGGYINTHRIYRTDSEDRVFQHAENQYFQTLVETGVLGTLLLFGAICILILCIRFIALRGNSPKTSAITVMGICLICSQSVAAMVDFGLFIPANTILMAVTCGFLAGQAHSLADRLKKKYIFRFKVPQLINMSIVLMIFVVSIFSLLSSYRYWSVADAVDDSSLLNENYVSMDIVKTEASIEELKSALDRVPDSMGLFHLSNLYIHRYRMAVISAWCDNNAIPIEKSEQLDSIWNETRLTKLHQQVNIARIINDQVRLKRLTGDPLVQKYLVPAAYYLKLSRSRAPLQPEVHLLLAIVHGISPEPNSEVPHLERAANLAPANSMRALRSGILHLQANRIEEAIQSLKRCLQLKRTNYSQVTRIAVTMIPPERIINDILPDDAILLGQYATTYLGSDANRALRLDAFRRIKGIFGDRLLNDRRSFEIKTKILEELGDTAEAVATAKASVEAFPEHVRFYEVAIRLLRQEKQFDEAIRLSRSLGRLPDSQDRAALLIRQILKQRNSGG